MLAFTCSSTIAPALFRRANVPLTRVEICCSSGISQGWHWQRLQPAVEREMPRCWGHMHVTYVMLRRAPSRCPALLADPAITALLSTVC